MNKSNIFGLPSKSGAIAEPAENKVTNITKKKLLLEGKSDEIIKKMLSIAVDDEHPGQMAALKMAIDRMLPVSEFDKDKGQGGIKTVIIDRSCGGKVIIRTGDSSIEIPEDDYSDNIIEGELNG
jgi:hypothetical protein